MPTRTSSGLGLKTLRDRRIDGGAVNLPVIFVDNSEDRAGSSLKFALARVRATSLNCVLDLVASRVSSPSDYTGQTKHAH